MDIFLKVVLSVIVSVVVTSLALALVVPLVIHIVGEEKFVETRGLDVANYRVLSGVMVTPIFVMMWNKDGFWRWSWVFPAAALLFSLHAAFWLWLKGRGHYKREFLVAGDKITRISDQQLLLPLWAENRSSYWQTDAFRGFCYYFLQIFDETGLLATNQYLREDEQKEDQRLVLEAGKRSPCRALDLQVIFRETPLRWKEVYFMQEWASLLCGSLWQLSPEGRAWWRQWLLPDFGEEGSATVTAEEFRERVAELKMKYFDDLKERKLEHTLTRLQSLLESTDGPVEILTSKALDKLCLEAAPNGGTRLYNEDYVELKPY